MLGGIHHLPSHPVIDLLAPLALIGEPYHSGCELLVTMLLPLQQQLLQPRRPGFLKTNQ